jgi:nitroreductase
MGKKIFRRNFFKKGMLLSVGMLFSRAGLRNLKAEPKSPTNTNDHSKPVNETLKTIQYLRTTHGNFTEQEIPDSQIQLILQSCIRTANASNMQTYSIIVVRDREKMKKVCQYNGSCMLLYCVDYTRLKVSAKALGHPYYPDSLSSFITGGTNAVLAAQTAVIAARSLGIDTLLTNGIHRGDMERVWDILELPKEYCYPMIALVLGYATKEPEFKKGRLDGTGVIHYDKYHKLTREEIEEISGKYDDKSLHIGLISDWEEQGHEHYLDWLFKYWLKRNSTPKDRETKMFKLLKRSGFVDLQKL